MVYRRVSKLFDYTLHVPVSWDLKLDISILGYTSSLLFMCILLYILPCIYSSIIYQFLPCLLCILLLYISAYHHIMLLCYVMFVFIALFTLCIHVHLLSFMFHLIGANYDMIFLRILFYSSWFITKYVYYEIYVKFSSFMLTLWKILLHSHSTSLREIECRAPAAIGWSAVHRLS